MVDNTYSFPFVSHATLEPHNCTADYRERRAVDPRTDPDADERADDRGARDRHRASSKVHVQSTRIGGGFGRRLLSDYAAEAAVVAQGDRRTGDGGRQPRRRSAARLLPPGGDAAAARRRRRAGQDRRVGSRHRELLAQRVSQGSARRRTRPRPTAATSAACSRVDQLDAGPAADAHPERAAALRQRR